MTVFEVGPLIYNKAVADVQELLQARIMDQPPWIEGNVDKVV